MRVAPVKVRVIKTALQMGYNHTHFRDMNEWVKDNAELLVKHFNELGGHDEFASIRSFADSQHDVCVEQAWKSDERAL